MRIGDFLYILTVDTLAYFRAITGPVTVSCSWRQARAVDVARSDSSKEGHSRQSYYISPHCAIVTSWFGLSSRPTLTFSIFFTTSMPSTTLPKTTCLLLRNGVGTVVMKNWQPFVLGPEF